MPMNNQTNDLEKITEKICEFIKNNDYISIFEMIKSNSENHEITVSAYFNLFEVLEDGRFPTIKQNGSDTFLPFLNHAIAKRDNRKTIWKKLVSTMYHYENREDVFSQPIDEIKPDGLAEKDIVHKVDDNKKLWGTRRSGETQSASDLKAILKVWRNGGTVMMCDDASSFKDESSLRTLEQAKKLKIRNVEFFSYSRTPAETVTRSFENAKRIIAYITQNLEHFDSILVGGLDLIHNLNQSVFLMIVSTIEGVWLNLANTKFYAKHLVYMEVLNSETELSSLPEVPKKSASKRALANQKEYRALLNYNNHSKERMMDRLEYLQNKVKK